MPPAAAFHSNRLIGIGLMAATFFGFALNDAIAKWLLKGLPTIEVVWARYTFNFILVLPLLNPWTTPGGLRTRRPVLQVTRSVVILLSTVFNFIALHYLQLAQTTAISFSAPLLVAVLAGPLLGEWIGLRRAIAVGVGFIGVLIVTQPGLAGFSWPMLWSFACALATATYILMSRVLSRHDSPGTTFFFVGLIGTGFATPVVPFSWVWPSSAFVWLLMVAMGAAAGFGHWCLILAHRHAPAPILAPFIYTQILWAIMFGWLISGDRPSLPTVAGVALVIASGLYLVWRERVVTGEVKAVAALEAGP